MGKIIRIIHKLNVSPNTLGCYGFRFEYMKTCLWVIVLIHIFRRFGIVMSDLSSSNVSTLLSYSVLTAVMIYYELALSLTGQVPMPRGRLIQ